MAGLHVASSLLRGETPYAAAPEVVLLESRPRAGGRVKSMYSGGALEYEAGPWRIPCTHKRAIALFERHGVRLEAGTSRVFERGVGRAARGGSRSESPPPDGMTTWGERALLEGADAADRADRGTGYADQSLSAKGSAPYDAGDATRFLVAPDGFGEMTRRAALAVERGGGRVRVNCAVVDLELDERGAARGERQYVIRVREKVGHNSFRASEVRADVVFLCVPPHVWKDWTCLRRNARSLSSAVEPGPLHHVYMEGHDGKRFPRRDFHLLEEDSLGQVVSSQYPRLSRWFQISYSAGKVAEMWRDFALSDRARFERRMREEANRLFGVDANDDREVRSHFWPRAYHKWKAVPGFDLAHAVRASLVPNPVRLPGLFCAGEAFSSYQAWIEGALETADEAVAAYLRGGEEEEIDTAGDEYVLVEGRRIDVSASRSPPWAPVVLLPSGGRRRPRGQVGHSSSAGRSSTPRSPRRADGGRHGRHVRREERRRSVSATPPRAGGNDDVPIAPWTAVASRLPPSPAPPASPPARRGARGSVLPRVGRHEVGSDLRGSAVDDPLRVLWRRLASRPVLRALPRRGSPRGGHVVLFQQLSRDAGRGGLLP